MTSEIRIPIPQDLEEDALKAYFQQKINSGSGVAGKLIAALDLDLDDDRATVDEVEIEEVACFEDEVVIQYTVNFSAYYGCSDQDYADEDCRTVTGQRYEDCWVFQIHISPEPRSTRDEF